MIVKLYYVRNGKHKSPPLEMLLGILELEIFRALSQPSRNWSTGIEKYDLKPPTSRSTNTTIQWASHSISLDDHIRHHKTTLSPHPLQNQMKILEIQQPACRAMTQGMGKQTHFHLVGRADIPMTTCHDCGHLFTSCNIYKFYALVGAHQSSSSSIRAQMTQNLAPGTAPINVHHSYSPFLANNQHQSNSSYCTLAFPPSYDQR